MQVQKIAISRALSLLTASGAKFKVIEADGTEYGELEVVKKTATSRRQSTHPHGTFTNHAKPYMDTITPNACGLVPYAQFTSDADRKSLFSSVTSYASREWGNGSYISNQTDAGIEVLRIS